TPFRKGTTMSDDLRKTVFGSRDTQFQGFAKLLQQEIWDTECSIVPMLISNPTGQVAKELTEAIQTLITQRAYDLVWHTIEYSGEIDDLLLADAVSTIPDLTQWPETPPTFQGIMYVGPLEKGPTTDSPQDSE
ncbi:MAG TPA: hypothetical protein VEL31_24455, partial [Ktedonobacteraceae bacterium]|nr:hypothetical protein [Ktedonobacteraceae bacterium]